MDAGMMTILENLALCALKARQIFVYLKSNAPLCDYYDLPDAIDERHFCFRLDVGKETVLYNKYGIHKVSVSVPTDAYGNRIEYDDVSAVNLPKTIEVALVDKEGQLTYGHPLVEDVVRFESVGDLVDFLKNLAVSK